MSMIRSNVKNMWGNTANRYRKKATGVTPTTKKASRLCWKHHWTTLPTSHSKSHDHFTYLTDHSGFSHWFLCFFVKLCCSHVCCVCQSLAHSPCFCLVLWVIFWQFWLFASAIVTLRSFLLPVLWWCQCYTIQYSFHRSYQITFYLNNRFSWQIKQCDF